MRQSWSLLIGQPGPLRNSLRYLLTSMAQMNAVGCAGDISSALHGDDEPCPYLVMLIVDTSTGKLDQGLKRLRLKWPLAKYLVMVDDERSLHMAQGAGADMVLLKGCRADKLVEAIELVQTQ